MRKLRNKTAGLKHRQTGHRALRRNPRVTGYFASSLPRFFQRSVVFESEATTSLQRLRSVA
jgi:hypothetical protein